MGSNLAQLVVLAVVVVWLLSALVALVDPSRANIAVQLTPIMSIITTGAITMLAIARKTNGKNGNGKP